MIIKWKFVLNNNDCLNKKSLQILSQYDSEYLFIDSNRFHVVYKNISRTSACAAQHSDINVRIIVCHSLNSNKWWLGKIWGHNLKAT